MTPRWKIALVAAAAAGVAAVAVIAADDDDDERAAATVPGDSVPAATEEPMRNTITVTGHGTVDVTPDIATVSFGVQATAPTGNEVMDIVGEKSQALVATLRALDIADEDLQTSGLNLFPNFRNDGTTVDGYQASVNVTVTARQIDRIGEIIDAAQGFVGDELTIGGISFGVGEPEDALGPARAAAIDNARVRAGQYATAADTEVGAIVQIVESTSSGAVPLFAREMAAADAAQTQVPIEPGSQELSVDVTVVFEMR